MAERKRRAPGTGEVVVPVAAAVARRPRSLIGFAPARLDELLREVDQVAQLEAAAAGRRSAVVGELRRAGVSWDGVGWVLGTTGEAARQRFGQLLTGREIPPIEGLHDSAVDQS